MVEAKVKLKRTLGLWLITFYGLGNILGAGIYVLVGKVAGEAGYLAPMSFFVASIIAAISAVTYAEMSSRYPVSAGEAIYIYEGMGIQKLAVFVGLLIAMSGIVSSAVISHGFAGYLQVFFDIPQWLIIVALFLTLGLLTIWGIKESVRVAVIMTVIEAAGLLIIIFVGADQLPAVLDIVELWEQQQIDMGVATIGMLSGSFLAFYAYIGFEDMVNVAEEVKEPQKNMPRAILLCVIISTILYSAVALTSILIVAPDELSESSAPLALVYQHATGREPLLISVIGLFAVINGALIQMIMSSRILYGMSNRGWLHSWFARVNQRTRTPVNSTVVTFLLMTVLALSLDLSELAELTSYLVLVVFTLVNLSLVNLKRKETGVVEGVQYSVWFPRLGFVSCLLFIIFKLTTY